MSLIDFQRLEEAYRNIHKKEPISECWSKEQQAKYDTLTKDGYSVVKKDEGSKKITLKHKLDGTEKVVTIDVDGKEHIHYGEEDAGEPVSVSETVSETNIFLSNLATRLQADSAGNYTSEEIYKLKEIAKQF